MSSNPGMPPTGGEGVNMEDHAPPMTIEGNGGILNIGSEAETHLPRETSPESEAHYQTSPKTDSHYSTEPSQSQEEQPQSNRQLRQEIQDPNQGRSSPTHFNADIALDRRLRKGRGTRSIKFHE
jgi:hypothetical protein